MEREIKFRAWDKKHQEMLIVGSFDMDSSDCLPRQIWGPYIDDLRFVKVDDCILLEFAGLKDKNGVEIYEGDILEIETEDCQVIRVVCKWGIARREMDTGWEVDIPSFYFERKDTLKSFPIVQNWQGKHDLEIMVVIGNIHENPELLNG